MILPPLCRDKGQIGLMGVNWFVQLVVKGYVILLAVTLDQIEKRK